MRKVKSLHDYRFINYNLYDVFKLYISNGIIKEPEIFNLISFKAQDFRVNDFEHYGNKKEFHTYVFERFFLLNNKKIDVEFKVNFFKDKHYSNNMSVVGRLRLINTLKTLDKSSSELNKNYQFSLENNMNEGVALFTNNTIIRFHIKDLNQRNYYISSIEGYFSDIKSINFNKMNSDLAKLNFEINVNKYMKTGKHHAFKKLVKFIKN